jgi:hypothetical protein
VTEQANYLACVETNTPTYNETVKYAHEFCRTSTQESLLWQGPEAIVQVNYRPILSSERAPHQETRNRQTEKKNLVLGSRSEPDTAVTVGRKLTSTSTSVFSCFSLWNTFLRRGAQCTSALFGIQVTNDLSIDLRNSREQNAQVNRPVKKGINCL